jgi:hypothetical protein
VWLYANKTLLANEQCDKSGSQTDLDQYNHFQTWRVEQKSLGGVWVLSVISCVIWANFFTSSTLGFLLCVTHLKGYGGGRNQPNHGGTSMLF